MTAFGTSGCCWCKSSWRIGAGETHTGVEHTGTADDGGVLTTAESVRRGLKTGRARSKI